MNYFYKEKYYRECLATYKNLIETISKIEYKKIVGSGLIELSEIIGLANYTVYYLINSSANEVDYNNAYITKAIRWAIRNEIRRRYKWYTMKNDTALDAEKIRDAVYKTILSIDELADAENPIVIKDTSRNPEEKTEIIDLKNRIIDAMQNLTERERSLIEAKYFYEKKLKDISVEYNISQSRISRIIQTALEKIKKEMLNQEKIEDENSDNQDNIL